MFDVYTDANRRDIEALRNYFSTNTSLGAVAVSAVVSTFRAMCDLADFETLGTATTGDVLLEGSTPVGEKPSSSQVVDGRKSGVTINLNIQLVLPETENSGTYERLFAALKKHLID